MIEYLPRMFEPGVNFRHSTQQKIMSSEIVKFTSLTTNNVSNHWLTLCAEIWNSTLDGNTFKCLQWSQSSRFTRQTLSCMNSLFITYNLLFSVSLYGYFITTQEKETELKSNCAFNTWFGYVWLHYICSQDSEFQISARNNTTIGFMVKNYLVFFIWDWAASSSTALIWYWVLSSTVLIWDWVAS